MWKSAMSTSQQENTARVYTRSVFLRPVPDHFARGAAKMAAESKQDIAEFPTGTKIIVRLQSSEARTVRVFTVAAR